VLRIELDHQLDKGLVDRAWRRRLQKLLTIRPLFDGHTSANQRRVVLKVRLLVNVNWGEPRDNGLALLH
jgi:hypothetical protein